MNKIHSDSTFVKALDESLFGFIGRGCEAQPDESLFNELALKEFELQHNNIDIYRRLCVKKGISPDKITNWQEIPAVPADAFKHFDVFCFEKAEIKRTFATSGTSKKEKRGMAHFDEVGLRLMDAAILKNAKTYLFPDNLKTRLLILAPSPETAPNMIMAYGMERLKQNFGLPDSRFLINKQGFSVDSFIKCLREAESTKTPVTIIGASFALANFFDHCRQKKMRFKLPSGSRSMDAGGYKGRSRELSRSEFLSFFPEILGIPQDQSVNLLGMTELGSQFYDNCFYNKTRNKHLARAKTNPPWTKTVVVDAASLKRAKKGRIGLLKHLDLSNKERVVAVQTDDIGKETSAGFEIIGRAKGAQSKGCSITVDEMTRRN